MDMPTVGIIDFADGCPSAAGLAQAYADGIRVCAGYRGSSAWKKMTPTIRDRVRGAKHGIAGMFEADDPPRGYFRALLGTSAGKADAIAARADWRLIGYPDSCFIAYAVDGQQKMANYPKIAAYFAAVKANDTCAPWAYVQTDIGERLFADGLIGGIFAPAAYGWNPNGKAGWDEPHVFWVQQHNGVSTWGGDVDRGIIRADANIWWPDGHTGPVMGEDDMTPAEFLTLLQDPKVAAVMRAFPWQYTGGGVDATSTLAALNGAFHSAESSEVAALATKLDALAAKVDALGTTNAQPGPAWIPTPEQLAAIAKAVNDVGAERMKD